MNKKECQCPGEYNEHQPDCQFYTLMGQMMKEVNESRMIVSPFFQKRRKYQIGVRIPQTEAGMKQLRAMYQKDAILFALEMPGRTKDEPHHVMIQFEGFTKEGIKQLIAILQEAEQKNIWN